MLPSTIACPVRTPVQVRTRRRHSRVVNSPTISSMMSSSVTSPCTSPYSSTTSPKTLPVVLEELQLLEQRSATRDEVRRRRALRAALRSRTRCSTSDREQLAHQEHPDRPVDVALVAPGACCGNRSEAGQARRRRDCCRLMPSIRERGDHHVVDRQFLQFEQIQQDASVLAGNEVSAFENQRPQLFGRQAVAASPRHGPATPATATEWT